MQAGPGSSGVVVDGLDAASVGEAAAAARPGAIVNQMTALSAAHAGKPNLRRADRFFAATNRLRSEGIDRSRDWETPADALAAKGSPS